MLKTIEKETILLIVIHWGDLLHEEALLTLQRRRIAGWNVWFNESDATTSNIEGFGWRVVVKWAPRSAIVVIITHKT